MRSQLVKLVGKWITKISFVLLPSLLTAQTLVEIDFELGEGFAVGDVFAASDWSNTGSATITADDFVSGGQALVFGGTALSELTYTPSAFSLGSSQIVFVDFFAKPFAFEQLPTSISADLVAATLAESGPGQATYYIYENGQWRSTASQPSIDGDKQTVDWQRYTYRLDFINKTVDIYEDSQLLAYDIPFIDPTVSSLNQFTISEGRALLFDYYYTGEDNPLFADNGTGLPLSYGARGSDGDFDGVLAVEEFLLGLAGDNPDSDADGWSDGREIAGGTDPLVADAFSFSSLPFVETFDAPLGAFDGMRGWTVLGDGTAVLQDADADLGGALEVSDGADEASTVVYNLFAAKEESEVWSDFKIKPQPFADGEVPEVDAFSAVLFYFGDDGFVRYYGAAGWVRADWMTPVSFSEYQQITVMQDYAAQQWSLWLNEEMVASEIAFAHASPYFAQFMVEQYASTPAYLDELTLGVTSPFGLDADWALDEGTGNIAYDATTNQHDAYFFNDVAWSIGINAEGGVLLDGAGDYLAVSDMTYQGTDYDAVSVSAWIKTSSGGNQVIASFDLSEYWRLEVNGTGGGTGQIGWGIRRATGGVQTMGSNVRVDDGLWHHVVAIFDDGTMSIYVDGVLDKTVASGSPTFGSGSTRYGFIGVGSEANNYNSKTGPNYWFNGNIDAVKIYPRALNETEIAALVAENSYDVDGDGLADWWEVAYGFDPGIGTGADGATGNADGDNLDNFAEFLQGKHPEVADNDASVTSYVYVDNATGNDANDGLRVDTAKASVNGGLGVAPDGGALVVSEGTVNYEEDVWDVTGRELVLMPVGNVIVR